VPVVAALVRSWGYFPAEVLLSADFASDFAAELSERLDVFGVIAAAVLSEGFAEVSVLDDAEPMPDGEDGKLLLLSFGFAVVVSEGLDVFGLIAAALASEGFGVLLLSDGFAVVSELDFEVSTGFEVSVLGALDDAELDVSGFGSSFADAAGCGGSGVAPATGVPAPDAASGAVPAPVGAAVGWFVDVATSPAAGATASAPVAAEGPACSVPGPVACACVCSCVGVCCAAGAATVPPPMVGTVTGAPVEASTVAPATVVPGANAEPGSTVAPTGVTRAGTGTASTDARNDATCVSMASAAACTSGDGACSAAASCVFKFATCDSIMLVTAARSVSAAVTGLTVGLVMRVSIRFSHTASRVLMVSIRVSVWACSKRVSTDCIHAVIAAHSAGGITGCPRGG